MNRSSTGENMTGSELERYARELVTTLNFAWIMSKPGLLQDFHRLVVNSNPATSGTQVQFDSPVHDTETQIALQPSEIQRRLIEQVVPAALTTIQTIAEETINSLGSNKQDISLRLSKERRDGWLNQRTCESAHHWRLVRNVLLHGNGVISKITIKNTDKLRRSGEFTLDEFTFWGPLLNAGHGGVPVPLTSEAVVNPCNPGPQAIRVPIKVGERLCVGLADVLAAAYVWSQVIDAICQKKRS
jgi:hypothetical protein